MNELDSFANLLYGNGEAMRGSQMTDQEALNFMRYQRLNTEYCLVRGVLDLD